MSRIIDFIMGVITLIAPVAIVIFSVTLCNNAEMSYFGVLAVVLMAALTFWMFRKVGKNDNYRTRHDAFWVTLLVNGVTATVFAVACSILGAALSLFESEVMQSCPFSAAIAYDCVIAIVICIMRLKYAYWLDKWENALTISAMCFAFCMLIYSAYYAFFEPQGIIAPQYLGNTLLVLIVATIAGITVSLGKTIFGRR